jgi:hypothetical protein
MLLIKKFISDRIRFIIDAYMYTQKGKIKNYKILIILEKEKNLIS